MSIDAALLEIVRCPETHQKLQPAEEKTIAVLNAKIEAGDIKDRGGETVEEKIDGGLLREDGKFLYPIRREIPVLLIDHAISME